MTKVVTKHPGSIATINYAIKAPSLDNSVIERGKNCKYQYNSGAVAPEVDALVSLLGIGGRACRNVRAYYLTFCRLDSAFRP